jgi:hypothetical protein
MELIELVIQVNLLHLTENLNSFKPRHVFCRVSVLYPAENLSDKAETGKSACLGCLQNSKVPIFVL